MTVDERLEYDEMAAEVKQLRKKVDMLTNRTANEAAANSVYEMYASLLREGFTDPQAFRLVELMLTNQVMEATNGRRRI